MEVIWKRYREWVLCSRKYCIKHTTLEGDIKQWSADLYWKREVEDHTKPDIISVAWGIYFEEDEADEFLRVQLEMVVNSSPMEWI